MKFFSLLICFSIIGCSSQKVLEKRPQYAIDEGLLHKLQEESFRMRTPASVNLTEVSPKRVYFQTLYQQYLAFTKLSQTPRTITHCPAFHTDFIEAQEVEVMVTSHKAQARALETQKELIELCDKGVTANYYKFENLVQYHAHKKAFHQNPASIFSLLKIPVFQNMYELKLTHGLMVSHTPIMDLTKAHWFTSYLEEFKMEETMIVKR